jgi:hypothetical protein
MMDTRIEEFVDGTMPPGCLQLKDESESQIEKAHDDECMEAKRLVVLAPSDWLVNG